MKIICWLSGHRPRIERALRIEPYSTWHGARVVCLGEGGHKNLGGGTLTQPRPDEFGIGMRQRSGEYFAPNPVLSFFDMDFALKFGGEDQKNKKKGLHRKI